MSEFRWKNTPPSLKFTIHSLQPSWSPGISPAETLLGQLLTFAVPDFLAASGFLYATRDPVDATTTLRRLRRALLPYLVASLAAEVYLSANGQAHSPGRILQDLLIGSEFGPYYFVFLIAVLILATTLFSRLPERWLVDLTLLLVGVLAGFVIKAAITDAPRWQVFTSPWPIRSTLTWWSYFLAGGLAGPAALPRDFFVGRRTARRSDHGVGGLHDRAGCCTGVGHRSLRGEWAGRLVVHLLCGVPDLHRDVRRQLRATADSLPE